MGLAAGAQSLLSTTVTDGFSLFTVTGGYAAMEQEAHASHPDLGHLVLLVLEAVLEVVFVSLPGYIVARQGLFDAEAQKFVANLNVMVFTPCLIFTKLASQLDPQKFVELAIIPLIFIVQTLVSYLSALVLSKAFRFKKRPRNFIIAMAVFGNSNSLPISLVLSLSHTISGLHWDEVPGDNDSEVAARGILYLMIFQQLGQLVRWTWGFNILLKPADAYTVEEGGNQEMRIEGGYRDDVDETDRMLGDAIIEEPEAYHDETDEDINPTAEAGSNGHANGHANGHTRGKLSRNSDSTFEDPLHGERPVTINTLTRGNSRTHTAQLSNGHAGIPERRRPGKPRRPSMIQRATVFSQQRVATASTYAYDKTRPAFLALPVPFQKTLAVVWRHVSRFARGVWDFMNPPLWAMLAAVLVASVPDLQKLFFTRGTFVNNSVTSAVSQSAGVAVPLILVVLGANLARNTLPDEDRAVGPEQKREERNLVIAAILSRMVFPLLVMAPLLALAAKYVPVSIVDDPIFIVVCFLLTGAPSALQLAQICQINGVYMGAMASLLFQSYVVWLLPSTIVLVAVALEVVEWAAAP